MDAFFGVDYPYDSVAIQVLHIIDPTFQDFHASVSPGDVLIALAVLSTLLLPFRSHICFQLLKFQSSQRPDALRLTCFVGRPFPHTRACIRPVQWAGEVFLHRSPRRGSGIRSRA